MFDFDQPKLKLGVAYTRRDTWMNKETESNKNDIIEKVSILAKAQDIEVFSTEDLELLVIGEDWLLIEILFLETLIFVSFSVYSNSVRLNSSK